MAQTEKSCPRCGIAKPLNMAFFHCNRARSDGFAVQCKACFAEIDRERYARIKTAKCESAARWYASNKRRRRALDAAWAAENPGHRREIVRASQRRRRASDDLFRVSGSLSVSVRRALRGKKGRAPWEALVGYTRDDLRRHLEGQFRDGMTWGNFGEHWELDHKRPIASFASATGGDLSNVVRKCWSLDNLQPLLWLENRRKGARYAEAGA